MRKTYVGLMLLAWAAIGPVANAGQIVLGADALQMNTFVSYTPPGPTGGSCGPASLSDVDALTASLRAGPQQLQSQLSFAGAVCHTMSASAAITSSEIQFALNGGTGGFAPQIAANGQINYTLDFTVVGSGASVATNFINSTAFTFFVSNLTAGGDVLSSLSPTLDPATLLSGNNYRLSVAARAGGPGGLSDLNAAFVFSGVDSLIAAVPEPATAALLALGLLGAATLRRPRAVVLAS